MSPYLSAYEMYRSQSPDIAWTSALDFHFQHGLIVSTPDLFVMARPVRMADDDREHLALSLPHPAAEANGLHVWIAVGTMKRLMEELRRFPWVHGVTFARRDGRVRRWWKEVANLKPWLEHLAPVRVRSVPLRSAILSHGTGARCSGHGLERDAPATERVGASAP